MMYPVVFGFCFLLQGALSASHLKYQDLIKMLEDKALPDVIPIVKGSTEPLDLNFTASLLYIGDISTGDDVVSVNILHRMSWIDPDLAWNNNSDHESLDNVTLPVDEIWTPDVEAVNSLYSFGSPKRVVVFANGTVHLDVSMYTELYCDTHGLDTSHGINCTLVFQSWTYDTSKLNLVNLGDEAFDVLDFESNKYEILGVGVDKVLKHSPYKQHQLRFMFSFRSLYHEY